MTNQSNFINKIKNILLKYPDVKYREKDGVLTVPAINVDGFDVEIHDKDKAGEYAVFGHIWHDHFSDEEQAINCFMFCLTKNVRLKITSNGKVDTGAAIEKFQDERWVEISRTGIFYFNFFQKKHLRYLQNDLVKR